MQSAAKALPIVGILAGLSNHFGMVYCYPSQPKIIELLRGRLGMFISIATLNRYLRVLEDEGYIKRTRRTKASTVRGRVFDSTMYKVLDKGLDLLWRIGVRVYRKVKGYVNGFNGKSKNGVQDPENGFVGGNGKSYAKWLAEGGKRPSFKQ